MLTWCCILSVVAALVLLVLFRLLATAPGVPSAERFFQEHKDTLEGVTYREIVEQCGEPENVFTQGDGVKRCTWHGARRGITLAFDTHNVCLGFPEK